MSERIVRWKLTLEFQSENGPADMATLTLGDSHDRAGDNDLELESLTMDLAALLIALDGTGRTIPCCGQKLIDIFESVMNARWGFWTEEDDDPADDEPADRTHESN